MGRRKTLHVVELQSGVSYHERTSNNLCTREFLEKKYDEAVSEVRPSTLYADTTTYHVDRIKSLFEEYIPSRIARRISGDHLTSH